MPEQFDLFKKRIVEKEAQEPAPSEPPYHPTDEEIAFAHGGKPVAPEKRRSAKEFAKKRAEDLKKLFEETGTQKDLPLSDSEKKQSRP